MKAASLRPLMMPAGALLLLGLFFLVTPLVSPYSPTIPILVEVTQPPSWAHPFGTDGLGRDLMTRMAVAGQASAFVAFLAALIVMLLALIAASITSVSGRKAGGAVHGLIDVFLTLPPLLVILTVAALRGGGGLVTIAIILGTFGWMQAARAAIEESAAVAASEYVTFARRAGMGRVRALVRHIIPGISGSATATFGTAFAAALLGEATLSFLGFGVAPPAPSLGRMIGEAGLAMLDHWWLATFPGAAVLLLAMSAGALGERLRVMLDPLAAMHSHRVGARVAPGARAIPGGATAGIARREGEEPSSEGLVIDGLEVSATGAGGVEKDLLFLPQLLRIPGGRVLAVVGRSGAGKSSFARALSGLIPASMRVAGSVRVDGASPVRGDIALVPQDPFGAFLPGRSIGWHFRGLRLEADEADHPGSMYGHPDALAAKWLERVGIADPEAALRQDAATMSGGELQRVALALALASGPKALIADEPTASLDTVASRELMALLRGISIEERLPLVIASHDIALVCEYADDLLALEDGKACGPVTRIEVGAYKEAAVAAGADRLAEAAEALWKPSPSRSGRRMSPVKPGTLPVLHAHDLSVSLNESVIVHDMEIRLFPGELVLMVGRSGVGKSTTLRVLDRWLPPTMGTVESEPTVLVPQNAARSVDPRMRVRSVIKEAARYAQRGPGRIGAGIHAMTPEEAAEAAGLDPRLMEARALTLSGGEARRLAIARGLVAGASVLLLDEPLSGLDPMAQVEMMEMLRGLTAEKGLTILMVSHDIQAAASCDRVIVMSAGYAPGTAGTTVEDGPAEQVLRAPKHSATRGLIEAAARF